MIKVTFNSESERQFLERQYMDKGDTIVHTYYTETENYFLVEEKSPITLEQRVTDLEAGINFILMGGI